MRPSWRPCTRSNGPDARTQCHRSPHIRRSRPCPGVWGRSELPSPSLTALSTALCDGRALADRPRPSPWAQPVARRITQGMHGVPTRPTTSTLLAANIAPQTVVKVPITGAPSGTTTLCTTRWLSPTRPRLTRTPRTPALTLTTFPGGNQLGSVDGAGAFDTDAHAGRAIRPPWRSGTSSDTGEPRRARRAPGRRAASGSAGCPGRCRLHESRDPAGQVPLRRAVVGPCPG